MDEEVLYSRVRFPWQILRRNSGEKSREEINKLRGEQRFNIDEQTKPVRDAYRHDMEIATEDGELPALYFLLYTVMWGRKTEYLLLWLHGWFLILQQKSRRC